MACPFLICKYFIMKDQKLETWIRVLLVICGLALIPVLFVPMWKIDLIAPQYPEGLMLLIYPDKLAGNVDIINGLNHYIGMKTLHTEDFIEFKILPYIIGFFAAAFVVVGLLNRKKLLYILFISFIAFGILAMYDFWRWEYNYGHNLDPSAAIIVPGMAYQPPLIGFKQLLNFGAYSIPDKGGWIFISVGALLLFCTVMAWRSGRKNRKNTRSATVAGMLLATLMLSCNTGPEPIKLGADNCHACKMTISDIRFGAELVTKKGKVYKFDDSHCLLDFLKSKAVAETEIKNIYLVNFSAANQLLNVKDCQLLQADAIRSPMGGNIAAFNNADSLKKAQAYFTGNIVTWNEINPK